MHTFHTQRRIEFADTDLGGIVHFSRFFVFMETAEHEFLAFLGTSVMLELEGQRIGWPRVAASCEYRRPARFGDVLAIELRVRRKGTSSVSYDFRFTRGDDELALGKVTAVCCRLDPSHEVRAIPIPASIAALIDVAPD
jgi:YbgC/YbaW family acyl-CoA thioester hydrolase